MSETIAIDAAVRSFCTFRADGRLYGIEVSHLREISTQVTTTPVPQAPPAVRGLTNLRSRIYLVIDLRPQLGLPPADCTADSRLIIIKASVFEDMGLLVDSGGDIIHVTPEMIEACAGSSAEAVNPSVDAASSLVVGVCKLETELMMIIDPARIAIAIAKAPG